MNAERDCLSSLERTMLKAGYREVQGGHGDAARNHQSRRARECMVKGKQLRGGEGVAKVGSPRRCAEVIDRSDQRPRLLSSSHEVAASLEGAMKW